MKQEFEMTEEQLQAIYDISRNQEPVIYVGVWMGLGKQEQANKLWQIMADEMGFVWDSVEPSSKGKKFFLAEPKLIVVPKTTTEISMDKFDTLGKIVKQLESCNYECEAGCLTNNTAFMKLKLMAKN